MTRFELMQQSGIIPEFVGVFNYVDNSPWAGKDFINRLKLILILYNSPRSV
jgi:hypothetical protein